MCIDEVSYRLNLSVFLYFAILYFVTLLQEIQNMHKRKQLRELAEMNGNNNKLIQSKGNTSTCLKCI